MAILGRLLVCFCGAIPMIIAAPATGGKITSFSFLYNNINNNNNNSAFSNSLVSSHTTPSLNKSTDPDAFIPPPDPCILGTPDGGMVVLSNYRSASRLDPSGFESDMSAVLSEAQADVMDHASSSALPARLVYVEPHCFFYVKPLILGVTWAVWWAALEQITLFHREWRDYTFAFNIVQPTRPGASATVLVADGQLRVL